MKKQKICVIGLWHLGSVISACFAKLGYDVIGFDTNKITVDNLKKGIPPVSEPNLENLIKFFLNKNLNFTNDLDVAVSDSDFILVSIDTPLDEQDNVDLSSFNEILLKIIPLIPEQCTIIVQSQVPVGTCNQLENTIKKMRPDLVFGISYIPENLRLGNAIHLFENPDRIVIGVDNNKTFESVKSIFSFSKSPLLKMNIKSAEMTKHAINAFLGMCISYINWLGMLSERLDVDISSVSKGLSTEQRIGNLLPLKPGIGFSGGTLGRDLKILKTLSENEFLDSGIIDNILEINKNQNLNIISGLQFFYPNLSGKRIGILGLVYKPNTNTLRRSLSIEIIDELLKKGAIVKAYDPSIDSLNEINKKNIQLTNSPYELAQNTDAILILTEWPEFRTIDYEKISHLMNNKIIFDFKNFLTNKINHKDYDYIISGNYSIKALVNSKPKQIHNKTKVLNKKISIVTGAGSGIGKSISLRFAKEGSHVILVGRDKSKLESTLKEINTLNGSASIFPVDVSNLHEVKNFVDDIISKKEKIDILVNSAGTILPIGPIHKVDLQEWEKCIHTNLFGTMYLIHEILPHMIKNKFGRIINLSGGGAFKPLPNFSAYSVSKSAVVRLTETVASEVKNYNIMVNAISPGPFDTQLVRTIISKEKDAGDEFVNAKKILQDGGGDINKVTELAVFLGSDECAPLTGKTIAAQWDDLNKIKYYVNEITESEKFTMQRV